MAKGNSISQLDEKEKGIDLNSNNNIKLLVLIINVFGSELVTFDHSFFFVFLEI